MTVRTLEKGAVVMARIIQIAAAGNFLFALDDQGTIYRFPLRSGADGTDWVTVPPPAVPRGDGSPGTVDDEGML
jgi:hypothetical protein